MKSSDRIGVVRRMDAKYLAQAKDQDVPWRIPWCSAAMSSFSRRMQYNMQI